MGYCVILTPTKTKSYCVIGFNEYVKTPTIYPFNNLNKILFFCESMVKWLQITIESSSCCLHDFDFIFFHKSSFNNKYPSIFGHYQINCQSFLIILSIMTICLDKIKNYDNLSLFFDWSLS